MQTGMLTSRPGGRAVAALALAVGLWFAPLAVRAQPLVLGDLLAVAMKDRAVPAMGALTLRDFKVEAEAERGVRRLGERGAAAQTDRWHLGSDGKAMTATMVARLVDEGRLSWTATLEQLLPEMAAGMRPEYRGVTLLELMAHRAGLGELDDKDPLFQAAYADARPATDQRRDWVRRFLETPPVGPVAGPQKYSNQGFIIAGYLAERATGRSYEQLMQAEVFRPLGMSSATSSFPAAGELTGHVDGRPQTPHDANPHFIDPAGAWRMTLRDWARFCIDQMEGERGHGRLLKTETYRRLHTGQGGTNAALGWGAAPKAAGRQGPALTHAGSDGNWYALVLLFPQTGNGVLVTANAADSMGGDKASTEALRALAATLAPPASP